MAARHAGRRRAQILRFLEERGPSTIFEVAAHLNCFDHQISGRFGELEADGLIFKTGQRRTKPETQCEAEVYAIAERIVQEPSARELLASQMGYAPTLVIDGDLFSRGNLLENDLPGTQYMRRPDGGGLPLHYRVSLVECDGCGRPLKCVEEQVNGQAKKTFRCGTPSCNRTWHLLLINEPGQPQTLALVLKHL